MPSSTSNITIGIKILRITITFGGITTVIIGKWMMSWSEVMKHKSLLKAPVMIRFIKNDPNREPASASLLILKVSLKLPMKPDCTIYLGILPSKV
jgi:hypothetical protein